MYREMWYQHRLTILFLGKCGFLCVVGFVYPLNCPIDAMGIQCFPVAVAEDFDEMVVYKDLKNSNFFSALSLPSFTRDWLLRKFENDEGYFDNEELASFVQRFIPKKNDWTSIKSRIVKDNGVIALSRLYIPRLPVWFTLDI